MRQWKIFYRSIFDEVAKFGGLIVKHQTWSFLHWRVLLLGEDSKSYRFVGRARDSAKCKHSSPLQCRIIRCDSIESRGDTCHLSFSLFFVVGNDLRQQQRVCTTSATARRNNKFYNTAICQRWTKHIDRSLVGLRSSYIYTVSQKNCASVILWITPWNTGRI